MHYRKTFRDAAKAALMADSAFAGFTVMSAWSQNIDADTLPAIGIATPRETKDLDSQTSSARETQLMVVTKIQGGDDLEDTLDDLSEAVELTVIPALETEEVQCHLRETRVELDGGGANRVGSLTMDFAISTWPVEPLTN